MVQIGLVEVKLGSAAISQAFFTKHIPGGEMHLRRGLAGLLLLLLSTHAQAAQCAIDKQWRVSFGEIPSASYPVNDNFLLDFIRRLAERAGVDLVYDVAPFARSMLIVADGKADMHFPFLQPGDELIIDEKLAYSDATFFDVAFYIYSRRSAVVTEAEITSGDKRVETDSTHSKFFPFPVSASDCLECSLRKLLLGRIDAFVFAENKTELLVRDLGLEGGIHREYYGSFPAKAVLPRTKCGQKLNELLITLVREERRVSDDPVFRLR